MNKKYWDKKLKKIAKLQMTLYPSTKKEQIEILRQIAADQREACVKAYNNTNELWLKREICEAIRSAEIEE